MSSLARLSILLPSLTSPDRFSPEARSVQRRSYPTPTGRLIKILREVRAGHNRQVPNEG